MISKGEEREMDNLRKQGYSEEEAKQIHADLKALAGIVFDVYKAEKRKMLEVNISDLAIGKTAIKALSDCGYMKMRDIAGLKDDELMRLHGVGLKALKVIRSTLRLKNRETKSG
jgi:DNA-directed RNA polymerase alpha subunit